MQAEPQKEHEWLKKLEGHWASEMQCSMGPDQPAATFRGSETVRLLGGLWSIAEGTGDMPGGGTARMIMTLGYDPAQQKYVGSWVGSMMTHMWHYRGTLDPTGQILTLDTEGPNCSDGNKMTRFQDIIEFKSDDHRILRSQMLGEDGKWNGFMTAHYRRVK